MGTASHLGHMDRVAATMPSQAHAGAAQEAPDIGQWEGQDVPLVRPFSCNVKGGIPSSRRYLPTYLPWPRDSGSPQCVLGVLHVQCFWLLGSCMCAACVVCGVLPRVALLCIRCCSAVRPACSRAIRFFVVVCVSRVGYGSLAPGPLPCLWAVVCFSACLVAPRCCAVPGPVRSLSPRQSAFKSLWCLLLTGAHAPEFTERLRGARGGWLRTGLKVPGAGRRRGRSAVLAPRRTCSGPCNGVGRGRSLQCGSWAGYAAIV